MIKVISSWQVIAVTVAVILYFSLINFVARTRINQYGSLRSSKLKKRKSVAAVQTPSPKQTEEDINDELGLEE